ncbi:TrkH family potassium uptake protein [Candidatus Mycoplasma haematominutum]|uniref:Potassium uptake protein, integral membrane component KtrB n=1 Tax=Candidatus Mycoplasma haematominutum 'Birmingham 1' TaxID=1116213 RepID=G8C367_9MOLU|nr:potassium transporter TrkG [Candidatus Mycoplasma haematominutum]CCE66765.1 potassium uptake protein, integral membrane component KtrB [Candidatus Mycoplasma haematominutum 'Birmingham 1']
MGVQAPFPGPRRGREVRYQRLGNLIFGRTVYQKLARLYAAVILLGFGALSLPFARASDGGSSDHFANFFTAVSSFTTTGLSIKAPLDSLDTVGQIVVLILIQIGGMGVVTIWTFLKHLFFKARKHTIEEKMNLFSERGGVSEGISYDVVKSALKTLFALEILLSVFLTYFFYIVTPAVSCEATSSKSDFWKSLHRGVFHAISAVNNAGLDIISKNNSVSSYSSGWGVILTVVFVLASVVGGIGYPVLYEVKGWIVNRRKTKSAWASLSLFSKISLTTYFSITVLASGLILFAAYLTNNFPSLKPCNLNYWEKGWQLVYLVFSSRSAGFAGVDLKSLDEKIQWALLVLMFIGASPASTAGGIRSITLFLILGKVWITIRGRRSLSVFSRTISNETIENAYIVFFVSAVLITVVSLFMPNLNNGQSSGGGSEKHAALFEAASAFGTSGLSLGYTSGLASGESHKKWVGGILLMMLMFVGQMGVPNLLLYYTRPRPYKQNFVNPEERLRIA